MAISRIIIILSLETLFFVAERKSTAVHFMLDPYDGLLAHAYFMRKLSLFRLFAFPSQAFCLPGT